MTGFEPRTSGIGSDHSTNWATTTALILSICIFYRVIQIIQRYLKVIEYKFVNSFQVNPANSSAAQLELNVAKKVSLVTPIIALLCSLHRPFSFSFLQWTNLNLYLGRV